MMSIRKARGPKTTIKELGGGRKCTICLSYGVLLTCNKCFRATCVNHMNLSFKECISCNSSFQSSQKNTPLPNPSSRDDYHETEDDEYARLIHAYYGG